MNDNKPEHWESKAPCFKAATEEEFLRGAWINEHHVERDTAKRICDTCKVRTECVNDALADGQAEGLRGGYWFSSGALLTKDKTRLSKEFPNWDRRIRVRKSQPVQRITNGGTAS